MERAELTDHQPRGNRILTHSWKPRLGKTVEESPKEGGQNLTEIMKKSQKTGELKFQERKGVFQRFEETKDQEKKLGYHWWQEGSFRGTVSS